MKTKYIKRNISLLLAIAMVFAFVPVQAFANDTENHSHYDDGTTVEHMVEATKTTLQQLQEHADAILLKYLGSTSMTDEEIGTAVDNMDTDSFYDAMEEIWAMVDQLRQLSEEELRAFADENPAFESFADKIVAASHVEKTRAVSSYGITARAVSSTVLDGQITVTDTASNVSGSDNTVTVTVKGSGGLTSGKTSSNTITVTNTSGNTAMVSFDYSCSATGTYTFSESSSGTYSGMLAAGESMTFTMTATGGALFSSSTATLKLSNFKLTVAKDSSSVTVTFDSAKGRVTANGTAVSSGTTLEGITPAEGVTLVATPANGYGFACWLNTADNSILSYDASFILQPENDTTVKAMFFKADEDAYFSINNILYYNLNEALEVAKSGDVIILANNGTLTAGDYTIPKGITLLIPFDKGGTVYTTTPDSTSSTTTPSAYRTLTMTDSANLIINGILSVPAKHNRNSGRPVEKYGYVVLEQGSSIKVNGALYAYGFISGKGTVKIMSGATVYEYFQIIDFRGGTATLAMYNKSQEVFPLSQYYIQNVEAAMTLEAGATEYGYTTLYMASTEYHSSVKFIGTSGAMFNLTSGSVTKQYDGATDRLLIKANGTMKLEPLSLSVSSMSLDSADYVLPINSSITIELESGTATINQDVALQPDAKLIIDAGATCKLASGIRMYVYDSDQWSNYVYSNAELRTVPYAPSRTYKSATSSSRTVSGDAGIQVAGTLDASAGKLYTTSSGAAITGVEGGVVKMASVSSGSTYQATQSGSDITFETIAVTSAQLCNANGSYVSTTANTYTYEDGVWAVSCDHNYTTTVVNATCTTEGSTTYTCTKCGRSYSEIIPVAGHTEGEAVAENVKEATCTVGGSYDTVVYCMVCSVELFREKITTGPNGHSWNDGEITTAAGCMTAGVKTITCSACGASDTEEILALGHDMIYAPVKDATCTEDGESASTYCDRCDYVAVSGGVIPALGHDWSVTSSVDATCTTDGRTDYKCSRCSDTKSETVGATGHTYNSVVTSPTCDAQGYTTYTCSACGYNYKNDYVNEVGHSYQGVVTAPTCTVNGYTTYTCAVCGGSYVGDAVTASGHNYGDGSVTLIANCTTLGARTYTCSVCSDSYTEEIAALGHDLKHHDAKLASYTSVGWDAFDECSRCGDTTYKEYPILKREPISDYETFLENLLILEQIADRYAEENPGEDPVALVLNYIRTGIASYTTTAWAIMAGNENTDFTNYVLAYEDAYNTMMTDASDLISVVSIRDVEHFAAPSDPAFALEFTHMFGTMDITYHNPGSMDHADVAGWSGDLVDLLDLVDNKADMTSLETVEEMVDTIFAKDYIAGAVEALGRQDMYGDLDAFYIMRELEKQEYHTGLLTEILKDYFVQGLTDVDRAAYFIANRMDGITNREQLREAVYAEYVGNKINTTLESTRTFVSSSAKLYDLRLACCYAFADYLWRLAGDYVEDSENTAFTVSSSQSVTLAPGIIQQANTATTADGKKLNYHVTSADLNQEYVRIDSAVGKGTVLVQAQNYDANVIAGINAGGIVAAGSYGNSAGLAAILTGTNLVRNGSSVADNSAVRAAGTAVGITKTGKAVFATVDNATQREMAQILLDAGCNTAVLLESGDNTSYVSRMENEDTFTDHTKYAEEVNAVLLMISTAPNNTEFDHAVLYTPYTYLTVNSSVQITASGVTDRGAEVAIPEGTLTWSVSDETVGSISNAGVFTADTTGEVEVYLSLNGEKIGSIKLYVVVPDTIYFTSDDINAYFGETTTLPLAALYNRKPVSIAASDVHFAVSDNDEGVSGGNVTGFDFTANEASGLKTVMVKASLTANSNVMDTISVTMYNRGDVVFNFENATGGSRKLAWLRDVSNATTEDGNTYHVVDPKVEMVADYTFAIDMSAIEVPEQLKELTSMLPGANKTDGTAWGFLLQLADRISDLSEVKADIKIDPNFDVDLTALSLQNEYITLSNAKLDEKTNVLTMTLNWIKQSAAIEPAAANPICVVSGVKLKPKKNAAWDGNGSLTPVHSGTLSYKFYLSADALYTFAGDKANQEMYGLTPYINPNNSRDKGASFGAEYASFNDSYTLVIALKNGWYFEEGKNVFYVDGVLHTEHTVKESTTVEPTCTLGGYTSNVCAVCGITYVSNETEALGHTDVVDKAVASTCTTTGLTEGKHCSVCNMVLVAQEVIEKLDHTYGAVTYTGDGKTSYVATRKCSCGDTQTATARITSSTTPATCTVEGKNVYTADFTEGWAEDKVTTVTIGKLDHTYGAVTYIGDGKTSYVATRKCSCGDTQTATARITSSTTPATCTAEGKNIYTADFVEEWAVDKTTTEVVTKLDHDHSNEWSKDASGHWYECSCGDKADFAVHKSNAPATETAAEVCVACGWEIAPILGHTHKYGTVTYTGDGTTSYVATRKCSCGDIQTATARITSSTTPASCTDEGKTVYTADFVEGWAEDKVTTVTIDKLDHTYGAVTYTGDGKTSYVATCKCNCGDTQTATARITSSTTPATCTTEGKTVYTADFAEGWAEDKVTTVTIDKLDHTYGAVTYTGDGKTAYVATRKCSCGDTQTATARITSSTTPATCTAEGKTVYTADFVEGWAEDKTTTAAIDKLEHNYVNGICSVCNQKQVSIAWKAASLTLLDNIAINFKAEVTKPAGYTGNYTVGALFWKEEPLTYTINNEGYLQIEEGQEGYSLETSTGRHVFTYSDIAAKEMNDDIYLVAYIRTADDQYIYSNPLTYSVVKCATTILNPQYNYSDEFRTLAVDMLNYGAAAQVYFNYRTDTLANAGLTDAQKAYGTSGTVTLANHQAAYGTASDNAKFTHVNLTLESAVWLNYKAAIKAPQGRSIRKVTLFYDETFTNENTWVSRRNSNQLKSTEMELNTGYTSTNGESQYVGNIKGLAAKDLRNLMYTQIMVTYSDGSVVYSNILQYSVETFAWKAHDLNNSALIPLADALMKYSDAAKAYLATLN